MAEETKYWQMARKTGRPPKYTPEALWDKAVEYFEWVEANPLRETKVTSKGKTLHVDKMRPMTVRAFCLYAGIDQQTFANYEKRAENPEFFGIIARIRDIIYQQKFEGACVDLFNANLIARELGLANKQEIAGPDQGPLQITGMVIR